MGEFNTLEKLKIRKDSGDGYLEYDSFKDCEAREILDTDVLRLNATGPAAETQRAKALAALDLTTLPAGPAGSSVTGVEMPNSGNDYTLTVSVSTPGKQTDSVEDFVSKPLPFIQSAQVVDNNLILTLYSKDDQGQYEQINAGNVRGRQGYKGEPGAAGTPGVGYKKLEINDDSILVATTTNNLEQPVGLIRCIDSTSFDTSKGKLTVTYTDKDEAGNKNNETFTVNSITDVTYDDTTGRLSITYSGGDTTSFIVNGIYDTNFNKTAGKLTIVYKAIDPSTGSNKQATFSLNYISNVTYNNTTGKLKFEFTDMDSMEFTVNCVTSTTFDQKTGKLTFGYSVADSETFTIPYLKEVKLADDHLMAKYAGSTNWADLGDIVPNGIESVSIDGLNLVVKYTKNQAQIVGRIVPKGISSARVTDDGELELTYIEGDTECAPVIVGNVVSSNTPLVEGLLRAFNAEPGGINLLDPDKVVVTSDGANAGSPGNYYYSTTDFIPVTPGNRYTVQAKYNVSLNEKYHLMPISLIEQYNAKKELLNSKTYSFEENQTIIEPDHPYCAYVKVTYVEEVGSRPNYYEMFVRGDALYEQFVPYVGASFYLEDVSVLSDNVLKSVPQELSIEQQETARANIKASTAIIIDLDNNAEYTALDIYNFVQAGNTVIAQILQDGIKKYITLSSVTSEVARFVDYSDNGVATVYNITNTSV